MALKVKKKYPLARSGKAHHTLPQRMVKRQRRRAQLRRSVMIGMVLMLLTVAGGIGYTWYMGQQQPLVAEQSQTPVIDRRATLKPPKIASNAAIGAAVQTYTPEVKPGDNASVAVRTNPEAACKIVVTYNDIPAVDSGLASKIADEFGLVSWSWTVRPGTPAGTWPAEVTCKNKKNSAFTKAEFVVK